MSDQGIVDRLRAIQQACGCMAPQRPGGQAVMACIRCEVEADLLAEIERLRAWQADAKPVLVEFADLTRDMKDALTSALSEIERLRDAGDRLDRAAFPPSDVLVPGRWDEWLAERDAASAAWREARRD